MLEVDKNTWVCSMGHMVSALAGSFSNKSLASLLKKIYERKEANTVFITKEEILQFFQVWRWLAFFSLATLQTKFMIPKSNLVKWCLSSILGNCLFFSPRLTLIRRLWTVARAWVIWFPLLMALFQTLLLPPKKIRAPKSNVVKWCYHTFWSVL